MSPPVLTTLGGNGPAGPAGAPGAAGAAGAAGAVGINWRGAFSPLLTYAVGDGTSFGGSSYRANVANGPASVAAGFIGLTAATASGSAQTVALPSGTLAGHVALLAICTAGGASSVGTAGFAAVAALGGSGGGSGVATLNVWTKTLTAGDITTGSVTVMATSNGTISLRTYGVTGAPYVVGTAVSSAAAAGGSTLGAVTGNIQAGDVTVEVFGVASNAGSADVISGTGTLNKSASALNYGRVDTLDFAAAGAAGVSPATAVLTIGGAATASWSQITLAFPTAAGFTASQWDVVAAQGAVGPAGAAGAAGAAGPATVTGADVDVATVGRGVRVAEGANAKQGVATLVAGTVTVANTSVTATSRIQVTSQTLGTVTRPAAVGVTARTVGTSFVIASSDATDTSVVGWEMFEVG